VCARFTSTKRDTPILVLKSGRQNLQVNVGAVQSHPPVLPVSVTRLRAVRAEHSPSQVYLFANAVPGVPTSSRSQRSEQEPRTNPAKLVSPRTLTSLPLKTKIKNTQGAIEMAREVEGGKTPKHHQGVAP